MTNDGGNVVLFKVAKADVFSFRHSRARKVKAEDGDSVGHKPRDDHSGVESAASVSVKKDNARMLCVFSFLVFEEFGSQHVMGALQLETAIVDDLQFKHQNVRIAE